MSVFDFVVLPVIGKICRQGVLPCSEGEYSSQAAETDNLEIILYIHSVSGKYQFILRAVSMEKAFLVWAKV